MDRGQCNSDKLLALGERVRSTGVGLGVLWSQEGEDPEEPDHDSDLVQGSGPKELVVRSHAGGLQGSASLVLHQLISNKSCGGNPSHWAAGRN